MRTRPIRPRQLSLVAAAVIAIVGLAVLLNQDAPFVEPASPEAVAESLMEAWVAGDGEAAAALFTSDGLFDGSRPGMLPALHDWFRAVGQEFRNEGCQIETITLRTLQGVSCAYTFENKLTRALGREPVTGSFLFYIGGSGIESASGPAGESGYFGGGLAGESGYSAIDDMFIEWVFIYHPDDFEAMYDPGAFLGPTSIALWERYTDELTASSEVATQFFMGDNR